jgi:hypothetical protein
VFVIFALIKYTSSSSEVVSTRRSTVLNLPSLNKPTQSYYTCVGSLLKYLKNDVDLNVPNDGGTVVMQLPRDPMLEGSNPAI